jgi:hypothetical protein
MPFGNSEHQEERQQFFFEKITKKLLFSLPRPANADG